MFHLFQASEKATNTITSSMQTIPLLKGLTNTPLLSQGENLLSLKNINTGSDDKMIPGLERGNLEVNYYQKDENIDDNSSANIISLKDGTKARKNKSSTKNFSQQGGEFLSFLEQHLNEKTIVEPLFKEGKKILGFFGNVKEGMAVIEPLDISKSSEGLVGSTKEEKQLSVLENKFNAILNRYTSLHKTMMEDILKKRSSQSSVKKYFGKSVSDENENYYYINDYGFTHRYTKDTWDKRDDSCPGDLEKITKPELDLLQNSTNMGTGQPCSVAGKNVKNEKTGEVAWVDIKGVKHIYAEDVWRSKEKSCDVSPMLLPDFKFNAIPSGSNMTSTSVCDQIGVEPKVWKQLMSLNNKLVDIAKKIQSKSSNLKGEEASIQHEIASKKQTLKKYIDQLDKERQSLENNDFDFDTASGLYDESVILSRKAEYEYLAWSIATITLVGIFFHQASR